jgi:Fibronectin type III domain
MGAGQAIRHIWHRTSDTSRGRRRRAVGVGLAVALSAGVLTAAPALAAAPDPDPPTGVSAVATGATGATVSWTAPAFDGGTSIVDYQISAKPGTARVRVGSATTSGVIDGLTPGLKYTFTVRAFNAGGFQSLPSVESNEVTIGDGPAATAPGVPTDVTAVPGDGSATITWTPPADDGGSPITGYRINSDPGATWVSPPGDATSWTFPGLTNGVSYTFKIRAVNDAGPGLYSDWSNTVVPNGGLATAPGVPTDVKAVAGNGSATVSWSAPTDDGGSAILQYRVNVKPGTDFRLVDAPATAVDFAPLPNGTAVTFTVKAINAVGQSLPSEASNAVTPTASQPGPGTTGYTATPPRRVLDTRTGTGALPAKVSAGQAVSFLVPGLPDDASAVALNITVTNATATTYLAAYPAGTPRPVPFSNINVRAGQTVANLAITRISGSGRVSIYNQSGSVDIIADVVGYFSAAATSGHTATNPLRVLDTRSGSGAPKAKIGSGKTVTVTLPGLPADATAAIVNITATNASARTYLTTYQAGTARPGTSSINLMQGQTVANLAVTGVNAARQITIYNQAGTVDVIADLIGYYAPSSSHRFSAATPARVLDTRSGLGGVPQARIAAGQSITVTIPGLPVNATAVTLNLTATNASSGTYLVAYADGGARPSPYSNINVVAGQTVANLAVSKVGPGGKVRIYNSSGSVDVIADLVGYYAP